MTSSSSPSASYASFPHPPTLPVEPFSISVPQADVDGLKALLRATRVPKQTYENMQSEENFGVSREWFVKAREAWLDFDWKAKEKTLNTLPQFRATVPHSSGRDHTVHFLALFSARRDAIPILMTHGWPGCYLEFWGLLQHVKSRYSPDDLPYHLIVPSLPGYAFSSPPPLDTEFSKDDAAYLLDQLMQGLGFGDKGYVAQGGDIGSMVSCVLGQEHEACKAIHINFKNLSSPPPGTKEHEAMKAHLPGPTDFLRLFKNFAYAIEHATRPSTVGLTVACNPMSLLCWIGEKYIEWSDESPSLDTILTFTSLYWYTDTYPSSIYTYRYSMGSRMPKDPPNDYVPAPTGYSLFPGELLPTPVNWVKTVTNLVWSKEHKNGGHFAALEKPEELWQDVEEFIAQAWGQPRKAQAA